MEALNFLPASLASSSRCCSRSSRNLRNMIHVSNGRRSRSPFSPLSFRMMSRADLRRLPSICDVVVGAALFAPFFFDLGGIEESLKFVYGQPKLFRAAEEPDN